MRIVGRCSRRPRVPDVEHGGEQGSALLLAPVVLMVAVTILVVVVNLASAVILQLRLSHIAQSCALVGARALSQSDFYQSGTLAIDPIEANAQVQSCVPQFPWPSSEGQISPTTQTVGAAVLVHVTAQFAPPLSLPFIASSLHLTLSAQSQAQEVPTGGL